MADLCFRRAWETWGPIVAEGTREALLRAEILRPEDRVPKGPRGRYDLGHGDPYWGAEGHVTMLQSGHLRVYVAGRRGRALARADDAFQRFMTRVLVNPKRGRRG